MVPSQPLGFLPYRWDVEPVGIALGEVSDREDTVVISYPGRRLPCAAARESSDRWMSVSHLGLCLCFYAAFYRETRLAPTDRQIGSIEFRSVFGL
jgi:hypothetical protein